MRLCIVEAVFRTALVATALLGLSGASAAQDAYPTRPVRIIVGFAVGSANDLIARMIAPKLGESLGQPVIVENKTGGGGSVGTDAVAKSQPDGHTIMLGTSSQLVMNVALYRSLPFDVERDLVPVGLIARTPLVLIAHPSAPGADLRGLIAYARANPGKLTYGSGGNGSISHIVPEHFRRLASLDLVHVPYRGNGPALVDLLSGQISLLFDTPATAAQYAQKGALRAYAVGVRRQPNLPGVPTFTEAGLPGFDPYTWNALMVPGATPRGIIERLNRDLNRVLADSATRASIERLGSDVFEASTTESAAAFIAKERAAWVPFVRSMNITLD